MEWLYFVEAVNYGPIPDGKMASFLDGEAAAKREWSRKAGG